MLMGVRRSWKIAIERRMTATSLKMPATERVTTEVRWINLDSGTM